MHYWHPVGHLYLIAACGLRRDIRENLVQRPAKPDLTDETRIRGKSPSQILKEGAYRRHRRAVDPVLRKPTVFKDQVDVAKLRPLSL